MNGAVAATKDLTGAAARREKGRQEMRELILREARRLLTEQGPEAVSMRAIARAMGYTPGALYEYFAAKEDIFEALYFEGADGLAGRMQAAKAAIPPATSTVEALKALGRAYRAYAHEHPQLFRLVFGPEARRPHRKLNPGEDEERPGFDVLVATIEEGIARDEVVSLPPLAIAVACWSMVHGFVVLELSGHFGEIGAAETPSRATDGLFEIALDGLSHGFLHRPSR